jgi:hypothetical protein
MTTSASRAKKTTGKKQWQKQRGEELELPSGNVALVRRPGPAALLKKGVLPDAMASMISDMIATGKGMSKEQSKAMANDPEMLTGMMEAMDKVLCAVVLSPHVLYHIGQKNAAGAWEAVFENHPANVEIPYDERDPEALYADDVDFEDKSFIFNYAVGGTRDVARFREESDLSLATLSDVEGGVSEPE